MSAGFRNLIAYILLAVAVGLLFKSDQSAHAQLPDAQVLQQQLFAVVEKTTPAIVEVHRRGVIFSGVIVSPQGHVLTAGHTITPGERYTVNLPDGRRMVGKALGAPEPSRQDSLDCGLIRIIDGVDLPYVPLGDASNLVAGQPCVSISYPGGQRKNGEPLVRLGAVASGNRNGRMIRTSALMEPGDSGGPLFDINGRVIGIHSRIGLRSSQNYDAPIELFRTYWDALNVPAEFITHEDRPMPLLGLVARSARDRDGVLIVSVDRGGIAEQSGLRGNDIVRKIDGNDLSSLSNLQSLLASALDKPSEKIRWDVERDGESKEIFFPTARFRYPSAERIAGIDPAENADSGTSTETDFSDPVWSDLPPIIDGYRAALAPQWSGTCLYISSDVKGSKKKAIATRIYASPYLVSKSSIVGDAIEIIDGEQAKNVEGLTIVARDRERDLILLRLPYPNESGVRLPVNELTSGLTEVASSTPSNQTSDATPSSINATSITERGQLLFSPTPKANTSWISVVGSSEFASDRVDSRGYMGVMLGNYEHGGVVLSQVEEGAALKAGLRIGDVITRIEDTPIQVREDVLKLLTGLEPATTIQVHFLRDDKPMSLDITLGAPPVGSDHAADMMDKSLRRDGFPKVFCHDATLQPDQCGGPVFDLNGNWVGLNIARYSRVRSFAIPTSEVADFVLRNME